MVSCRYLLIHTDVTTRIQNSFFLLYYVYLLIYTPSAHNAFWFFGPLYSSSVHGMAFHIPRKFLYYSNLKCSRVSDHSVRLLCDFCSFLFYFNYVTRPAWNDFRSGGPIVTLAFIKYSATRTAKTAENDPISWETVRWTL